MSGLGIRSGGEGLVGGIRGDHNLYANQVMLGVYEQALRARCILEGSPLMFSAYEYHSVYSGMVAKTTYARGRHAIRVFVGVRQISLPATGGKSLSKWWNFYRQEPGHRSAASQSERQKHIQCIAESVAQRRAGIK
jgi:hypothetical protein